LTNKPFLPIPNEDDDSPFQYIDTASSRAEIVNISHKLEKAVISIIGLGGTGSYILDLVAKTPIKEIRLFDSDVFSQHNAFRSPGAISIEKLRELPLKVFYYLEEYSKIHRGIKQYSHNINESNIAELDGSNFVFISIDNGSSKEIIVRYLESKNIPFIDVGMGIHIENDSLFGIIRTTTSTPEKHDHIWNKKRIPFNVDNHIDEYKTNIQVADLNALNACLAVIKWKKLLGFYSDLEMEYFSTYTIDGNMVINEDQK